MPGINLIPSLAHRILGEENNNYDNNYGNNYNDYNNYNSNYNNVFDDDDDDDYSNYDYQNQNLYEHEELFFFTIAFSGLAYLYIHFRIQSLIMAQNLQDNFHANSCFFIALSNFD